MSIGQWPRRADPFLDRTGPRRRISDQLTSRCAQQRVALVCVHAPEGMGRYSLAAEIFGEHRESFDRDYIEIAARQADGRPTPLGEMVGQALRGLGLADVDLPGSDAARLDRYQRLSTGRRFLMVVRDVVTADQVRPLIPASAPGAAVLVTSRTALRELYAEGFIDIALGKLPEPESRQLLVDSLGTTADRIDVAVVSELADLCDGYPLLIRLLAAHLVGRPRAATRILAEVRASESALLQMTLTQRLATFLTLAYEGLVRELKQAYRQVSLIPGTDFAATTAAVALNTDADAAEDLLEQLVDANLLIADERSGRFSFHTVIRADAQLRAREVDGADVCSAITARLVRWFLAEAVPRDAALADRWRVGEVFAEFVRSGQAVPPRDDAIAWFESEWQSVVACVVAARSEVLHEVAWQLCIAAFKFLHQHGHTDAWLESHRLGIESAEADGDLAAVMQLTNQRGAAWLAVGERAQARKDFETSLAAATRIEHPLGMQSNHEWIGKVEAADGNLDAACESFDRSEAVIDRYLAEIPVAQVGRMRALLGLQRARVHVKRAAWADGFAASGQALGYFGVDSGERENRAKCLIVLSEAAEGLGDVDHARSACREAGELFAADGLRRLQAGALLRWGRLLAPMDVDQARAALGAALEHFVALGDPAEDLARSALAGLGE